MQIRHLKIPVNFNEISAKERAANKSLTVSWEKRNLYVAFLWMQRFSLYGRIKISDVPKRHFHHWINKLIGAGWMRKENGYYVLISNERVWNLLKIKKVNFKNKHVYYFRKLPKYYKTWSEFKKKIIDDIMSWQTDSKKRQLLERHKNSESTIKTSLLSAQSVASLYGFRSSVTGSKYRNKYFDVVVEPLRIREHLEDGWLPYWKYDCKSVILNKVFSC